MEEEMEALHKKNTWELVTFPKGRKDIGNKWVLKLKRYLNDNLERCKAQFSGQGVCTEIWYGF